MTDFDLLREFRSGSEDAFATLVKRHLNAVYSIALRRIGRPVLAEEVTFTVFEKLARRPENVSDHAPMIAWLFKTTRHTALDLLKRETRRRAREEAAAELLGADMHAEGKDDLPLYLESALESLREPDRQVLLLRYYENRTAAEIARTIRISEEAAQKRIERALERLRGAFVRAGRPVTAASLGAVLATEAIQAAPAHCLAQITTLAQLAGTAGSLGAGTITLMSTTQKAAVILISAGVLGTGIYQRMQVAQLRTEISSLRLDAANTRPAAGPNRETVAESPDVDAELARLRLENKELHKLRGEVTGLRKALAEAESAAAARKASEKAMPELIGRMQRLKEQVALAPEEQIPELQLAGEKDWLEAAAQMRDTGPEALRKAMAHVRTMAKGKFAMLLNRALKKFVEARTGELPAAMADLKEFIKEPLSDSVFDRYEIVRSGRTNNLERGAPVIQERKPASAFDTQYNVSLLGAGYALPGSTYGFSYDLDDMPAD